MSEVGIKLQVSFKIEESEALQILMLSLKHSTLWKAKCRGKQEFKLMKNKEMDSEHQLWATNLINTQNTRLNFITMEG